MRTIKHGIRITPYLLVGLITFAGVGGAVLGAATHQTVPSPTSNQAALTASPVSNNALSGSPAASANVPNATSECAPTTDPGSSGGSPATLESSSSQVASGTVNGESWSLWSANGQSGANGLENGGLVLNGNEYGLCPGYPNPAELEVIDTGSNAVVAGVVGYAGSATVDLSESTVGTFDVGQALPSPQVQVVNGVSFFIGALPDSACDYSALELNTTSPGVSAEHNIGFGACASNELVPITASQGIWQLPPGQFPANFANSSSVSPSIANVPTANSTCSPTTDAATSGGSPATLESSATQVASGTVNGQAWSLWSATGQTGATGLEDGGLVLGGNEYGLCPGYPNPAELEMIDAGSNAIVAGVIGYPGLAKVDLSESTVGTFDVGQGLPSPQVQVVNGVSFFIGALPDSACDYSALELNSTSPGVSAEHNLGFGGAGEGRGYYIPDNPGNSGGCVTNEIDPISFSQGIWQLPPGQFPNNFRGSGAGSPAGANVPNTNSDCAPTEAATSGGSPATLESSATQVASGTVNGEAWSLWSAKGETGATGLENGGLVLGGNEYGLCPGYPNPAELEMIDAGSNAIVAGVVGYSGLATVDLSESTVGTFDVGQALPSPQVQAVNGVSFFIGTLPSSACDYSALELNTTSNGLSSQHNLGFGACVSNQLVPITASQGSWQD